MKQFAIYLFVVAVGIRAITLIAPEAQIEDLVDNSTDVNSIPTLLTHPIDTVSQDIENFGSDLNELGGLFYSAIQEPIIPGIEDTDLSSESLRREAADSMGVEKMILQRKQQQDESTTNIY